MRQRGAGHLRERPLDAATTPASTCAPTPTRTRRSPSPRWPRPPGPRLAGRYGHGLLSVGATTAAGFDVLGLHWDVMEERAAHYGVTRRPQRLAPRRADAPRRDPRAGLQGRRARHRRPGSTTSSTPRRSRRWTSASGTSVKRVHRLRQRQRPRARSARPTTPSSRSSGCGSSPTAASAPTCSWPTTGPRRRPSCAATTCSPATSPRFQGQAPSTPDAKARARAGRPVLAESNLKAVEMATAKYEAEKAKGCTRMPPGAA